MPKSSCQLCQRQPGALGAIPNAASSGCDSECSSGCDSECTRRQTPKQMVFENKLLRLMLVLRFLTHKGHVIKVPKEALAVAHSHSIARQILNSHVVGQIVRVIEGELLSWNLSMCSMSCAVLQVLHTSLPCPLHLCMGFRRWLLAYSIRTHRVYSSACGSKCA